MILDISEGYLGNEHLTFLNMLRLSHSQQENILIISKKGNTTFQYNPWFRFETKPHQLASSDCSKCIPVRAISKTAAVSGVS